MQALFMVLPNLNEAYESFRKISISQLSNLDIHHLEWCGICGRIGKWEFLAIWRYIQLWIHVLANLLVLSRWYININSWKVFSWYSSNTFLFYLEWYFILLWSVNVMFWCYLSKILLFVCYFILNGISSYTGRSQSRHTPSLFLILQWLLLF